MLLPAPTPTSGPLSAPMSIPAIPQLPSTATTQIKHSLPQNSETFEKRIRTNAFRTNYYIKDIKAVFTSSPQKSGISVLDITTCAALATKGDIHHFSRGLALALLGCADGPLALSSIQQSIGVWLKLKAHGVPYAAEVLEVVQSIWACVVDRRKTKEKRVEEDRRDVSKFLDTYFTFYDLPTTRMLLTTETCRLRNISRR